jgi:hypothetical protein
MPPHPHYSKIVARPLPPLPPESPYDIEGVEDGQVHETVVGQCGRILEQTFLCNESDNVDRNSKEDTNPGKHCFRGGPRREHNVNNSPTQI